MRKPQNTAWWRALRGRWNSARPVRDTNDMADMGTAFGLDACLQAELDYQAFQEARRAVGGDSAYNPIDRLNGRSVI